jgi:thioredoxin 1
MHGLRKGSREVGDGKVLTCSTRYAGLSRWVQLLAMLLLLGMAGVAWPAGEMPALPVPGQVTLVEIGSKTCAPCLALLPMLEQLRTDYQDQVAVVLIELWEHPDAAYDLGIKQIPAFLFYNRHGNEVRRHEGALDREEIVAELDRLISSGEAIPHSGD